LSSVSPIGEFTRWSIESDRQRVEVWFTARIKVEIEKGYHLYSTSQPAGGPLPTRVTTRTGISVTRVRPWPKPVRAFDAKFGMETECHFGSVIFDVDAKVETTVPAGQQDAVFTVEYQLCDEQTCLRPEAKELRVPIYVEAADQAKVAAAQVAAAEESGGQLLSWQRLRLLYDQKKKGRELEDGVKEILKDDPGFISGYVVLSSKASERGERRLQRAVLRRGLAANPGDETLLYHLADCASPPKRRLLLNELIRRFPRTPIAVTVLLDLAESSTSRTETRRILERAYRIVAGKAESIVTLRVLCPFLVESDPARVVRLLKSALRSAVKESGFFYSDIASSLVAFYTSVAEIQRLLKKSRKKEAVKAAQALQEPDLPHHGADQAEKALVALVKAKALAADGQIAQAYESLIQHPLLLHDQDLLDEVTNMGARLRKSGRQVKEEAWQWTLRQNYSLAEFAIPDERGRSVREQDYRGRVVLVNAWNPG
jgi:hypothetical protein